ncbi:MAG TPA: hybrid sensor histidine kinase/response regulator, partial [Thiotrichales bacterium]|nr:hybrid sensor histidine kinase/response regulator [Thiotrichales bacterium]
MMETEDYVSDRDASERLAVRLILSLVVWLALSFSPGARHVQAAVPPIEIEAAVLEDPEGALSPSRALEAASDYLPLEERQGVPVLDKGFHAATFWLRVRLVSHAPARQQYFIELANPLLDDVHVYRVTPAGPALVAVMGDVHPFDTRPVRYRNPVFATELEPEQPVLWLVRLRSTSSLLTPIRVWDAAHWQQHRLVEYSLIAALYGGILIFLFYNLFLFLALQDRTFLYYCLYMGSVSLTTFSLSGMSFVLFWPDHPSLANHAIPMLLYSNIFFATLFVQAFIPPAMQPGRFQRLWRVVGWLSFGLMVASLVLPYTLAIHIFSALAFFAVGGLMVDGMLVLHQGYRPARYFLLAMSVFLVLGAVRLLMAYSLVPQNLFTEWSSQIGVILEAILLSLALADRINTLKQEKEAAQAEAIRNLQRADELKNEFLANTTHELRTPLNGIIGLATGCLEQTYGELNPRQRHVLELMLSSAERLLTLINDILDFTQIREGRLRLHIEPVEISPIIDNVAEMVQPLIGPKPLSLVIRVEEGMPPVLCDRERLRQVVYNLLSNAIKFTSEGSVRIEVARQGECARLRICDTGPGMDESELEKVMQPFERSAPESVEGTGLGLPITRRLVDAMQGRFEIESRPGQGTCAQVLLPLAEGETAERKPATASRAHAQELLLPGKPVGETPGQARILVVEDDPVNMRTIVDALVTEGYRAMPVYYGSEVEKAVEEFLPDLVLLDLMLPDMDGYDVCMHLRERHDEWILPILVLTARVQEEDIRRAFNAGCNDYITKPFLRKELLARIRAHLSLRSLVRKTRENDELLAEIRHRMQTESDLVMLQRLLVSLLDQVEEGLITFDVRGRVLGINQAARRLLGLESVSDSEEIRIFEYFPELSDLARSLLDET